MGGEATSCPVSASRPSREGCGQQSIPGTSLVVQWLGFHPPLQGVHFQSLVGELESHTPWTPKRACCKYRSPGTATRETPEQGNWGKPTCSNEDSAHPKYTQVLDGRHPWDCHQVVAGWVGARQSQGVGPCSL